MPLRGDAGLAVQFVEEPDSVEANCTMDQLHDVVGWSALWNVVRTVVIYRQGAAMTVSGPTLSAPKLCSVCGRGLVAAGGAACRRLALSRRDEVPVNGDVGDGVARRCVNAD